jgi:alkylation response protein AidB-like acyl-CoA dehydrogenase
MTIPPDHGGRGASYLDAVLVIEEMAKCCGITGRIGDVGVGPWRAVRR